MALTEENYTFLPFLKRGIGTKVPDTDNFASANGTGLRPTLDFQVQLTGASDFTKSIDFVGPGEVESINESAVLRHAPVASEDEFLPNYLPFIEFQDEDFPWRYTPLKPGTPSGATKSLRPWMALIVLKRGGSDPEFEYNEGLSAPNRVINILKGHDIIFPNQTQTWAWAHVQIIGANFAPVPTTINQSTKEDIIDILDGEPYRAISRIICPRRLQDDTDYTAFLVPTFELGRQAGLGMDVSTGGSNIQEASWDHSNTSDPRKLYPIYYSFDFKTGTSGDFEALARRIKAAPADGELGKIPINISQPNHPKLNGVANDTYVEMGGTMRQAGTSDELFLNTGNDIFVDELQNLVNLGANMNQGIEDGLVDPVISLPFYGRWHAVRNIVLQNEFWLSELNLDPKNRAAAGLGATVFKENQDAYMEMAWKQVGEVIAANRKLEATTTTYLASDAAFEKHIKNLPGQTVLNLTASVHHIARDKTNNQSVKRSVKQSRIPRSMTDTSFTRFIRPNGPVMRKSNLPEVAKFQITDNVANNSIKAKPANTFPSGREGVAEAVTASDLSADTYSTAGAVTNFLLLKPGANYSGSWQSGGQDSPQSGYFKTGAAQTYTAIANLEEAYPIEPDPLNTTVTTIAAELTDATIPEINFTAKINFWLKYQGDLAALNVKWLQKPMAAPSIDLPVFDILKTYSKDLIIPNFHLVGENTVTLLETNNKFIESLMVGLNYEMGRELLWNQYPTDKRATFFQRFWDSPIIVPSQTEIKDLTEAAHQTLTLQHRNIDAIHKWAHETELGTHNSGFASGEANLVLVIRADLLKKFPNLELRAVKAFDWQPVPGQADTYTRDFPTATDYQAAEKKYPVFFGQMPPDALLLGFDLTAEDAKGENPPDGESGWYFEFSERLGDIRFGLDEFEGNFTYNIPRWDDLTWAHMGMDTGTENPISQLNYIDVTEINIGPNSGMDPIDDPSWGRGSSHMAAILNQKAVKLLIHANDLID